MPRSSRSEQARRINEAWELLKESESLSRAAQVLCERHGFSKRQAYRYLHEARRVGGKVPIPGSKVAFTVKLPRRLVSQVRGYARSRGLSLSEVVTRALEAVVGPGSDGG